MTTGDRPVPIEDEICICFRVRRDKVIRYIRRERPKVVSLVSECLSAGTGCGWCIPFLEQVHEDVMANRDPGPPIGRDEYMRRRTAYRAKLATGDPDPRA